MQFSSPHRRCEVLCDVCQKIDIREMLLMATWGHTKTDDETNTDCRYCTLLDNGILHHETYTALKAASDSCGFCRLIRQSLIDAYEGDNSSTQGTRQDEVEQCSGPVVLFPFNLEASFSSKGEPPQIEVRVGSKSRQRIDLPFHSILEAFAPRGMLFRGHLLV
jgi:hypothetical protein